MERSREDGLVTDVVYFYLTRSSEGPQAYRKRGHVSFHHLPFLFFLPAEQNGSDLFLFSDPLKEQLLILPTMLSAHRTHAHPAHTHPVV